MILKRTLKMTLRNKINLFIGIVIAITISSCNNGASAIAPTPGNTPNTTKHAIVITGATQIPLTERGIQLPYIITNNTSESLFNINYAINETSNTDNLKNNLISIDPQSMTECKNLNINETCSLIVDIARGSKVGSIALSASIDQQAQNTSLKSILSLFSSSSSITTIGTLNIGLNNFTNTDESGTNGIAIIYDNTITKPTTSDGNLTDYSNIVITLLATSPNIQKYESLILQDSNRNNLPFTVLYGNPDSLQTLDDIAIIEVKVPANTSQLSFAVVLTGSSSSNNTSNIELINLVNPETTQTAILQSYPLSTQLTNGQSSQVVTIVNTGNAPATDININAGPNTTITNNSCTATLNPDASCNYVISTDSNSSVNVNGSSYTDVTYFDNISNQYTANIINNEQNLTGNTVGLQIISSNPNNNFITTNVSPSYSSLLELKNIGTKTITLKDFPNLPNYTIESGISNSCIANQTLVAGEKCTLQIIYTNSTVSSSATPLNFNYTYQDQNNTPQTVSSGIELTSNTLEATANIVPNAIADIIANSTSLDIGTIADDNFSKNAQTITFTNIGQADATGFDASVDNVQLFTILNNTCTNLLPAGKTCSFDVKFGPSNKIESTVTESTTLTISYQTNGSSSKVSTNIGVSGQIIHNANVAFIAGDHGIYKVDLSSGATTQVYTNSNQQYNSIARNGNTIVAVGTNMQVVASTDGGNTWIKQQPFATSGTLNSVTVNKFGVFGVAGNGSITGHSATGESWIVDTFGSSNFISVTTDTTGNFITVSSDSTAQYILTFGNYQTSMYLPQYAPYYSIDITPNDNYLVGGYNGALYLSTNQGGNGTGGNWVDKSLRVICARDNTMGNDNVNSIISNTNISVGVGNCGYTIYSTDQGITWYLSNYPVNDTNYEDLNSVNFVNNTTWVAVGTNGMVRTSTDGQKWSVLPTGLNVTFRGVSN